VADAGNLREAAARNQAATRRLAAIAAGPYDLTAAIDGEWTVEAHLAHIAFWDRFVLGVLDRWERGVAFRIEVPDWYDETLNAALAAGALALPAGVGARLALEAASAVDARLAGLTPSEASRLDADAALPETDANWLVHRYRHREEHLDSIETALGIR